MSRYINGISFSKKWDCMWFLVWLLIGFLRVFFFYVDLVQIVDPKLASYGVENPIYAVIQLAQTTMRSELGKITLDKTFEERDTLNEKIVVIFLLFFFTFFEFIPSMEVFGD